MKRRKKTCQNPDCPKRGRPTYIWSSGLCRSCALSDYVNRDKAKKKRNGYKKRKRKNPDAFNVLVKKADRLYSMYVRISHADDQGMVKCYTCDYTGFWKRDRIECGHFISRGAYNARWRDPNGKPQCKTCNQTLDGNEEVFREGLLQEYGQTGVQYLETQAKEIVSLTSTRLKEIIQSINKKLKLVRKEKGL